MKEKINRRDFLKIVLSFVGVYFAMKLFGFGDKNEKKDAAYGQYAYGGARK